MFLTQRVLQFRREHADLFQRGEYSPVRASGTFAECCVSLGRELAGKWIVVIAPRLTSRIGFPPVGKRWKDTTIELPEALSLANAHDLFTCHAIAHAGRKVPISDAMSILSFAVITNL
jgi:(1->4)-alpha-D-glucan 1-alpha-D-glucosylmutase